MAAASLCVIVLGWGVAGAAGVHYLRIEGACYIGIGYYLKTKTAGRRSKSGSLPAVFFISCVLRSVT